MLVGAKAISTESEGVWFLQASQQENHRQDNAAFRRKVELPHSSLRNGQDTQVQEQVDDTDANPKRLVVNTV